MLIRAKRNAGRAIVLDYSTTDPIADPRYSGAKPSKNPDYKVTNTIFLPTGRSGLETLRFLTAALIKIRNPRFHGSRCTREPVQHTPRNFTANYSFNSKRGERERAPATEAFKLTSESFVLPPRGPTLLRINQPTLHNVQPSTITVVVSQRYTQSRLPSPPTLRFSSFA